MFAYREIPGTVGEDDVEDISELIHNESIIDVEIPMSGLLIKESIVVSNCSKNQIEGQTSNISHFCTGTFNLPLFIKLRASNNILMGRLADLFVYSGRLNLRNFKLIHKDWIERQNERVQPGRPVFVTIHNGENQIHADLHDISHSGMSLLVEKGFDEWPHGSINSDVVIGIKIPPWMTPSKICARIIKIDPISKGLSRVGLQIFPNKSVNQKLDRYLTARKQEIFDEVFNNFTSLLKYRETKDMYF